MFLNQNFREKCVRMRENPKKIRNDEDMSVETRKNEAVHLVFICEEEVENRHDFVAKTAADHGKSLDFAMHFFGNQSLLLCSLELSFFLCLFYVSSDFATHLRSLYAQFRKFSEIW